MQRSRRMKHRHHQPPAELARLPVNGGDAFNWKPARHRHPPQRHNHARVNQFNLALKIAGARRNLRRLRIAVFRRAALDDVCYVNLRALQAAGSEQLIQKFSGRTHKRPALLVFVAARSFANQHHRRRRRPFARHGKFARLRQRA